MKTSNKILLVFFIVTIGFLLGTRALLYNRYINKKYTPEEAFNTYFYRQYNLPQVKHVHIENIAECQLLTAAAPKLMVEKNGSRYASYEIHSDTLLVKGYTGIGQDDNYKLNRSPQEIKLYLPAGVDITAVKSNISVKGDTVQTNAAPFHIALNYSTLNTRIYFFRDTVNRYFDTMFITAKNRSGIYFTRHDFFKGANITLDSSEINDGNATINGFTVMAGKSSTVVATGNNITKLNTTGSNR